MPAVGRFRSRARGFLRLRKQDNTGSFIMRSLLLVGGLVATMAVPALAEAQTRCERDRSTNRAAGTVVGAGIGALLGSAIAGNSSNTAGTIAGGVAGAIAGNQLAKRAGEPCPPGYYETPTTAPVPAYQQPYDSGRFWSEGPVGVRERIDFLETRVRRGVENRTLTRREADRAYRELAELRQMERTMRRRGGGRLNATDREYLQARLDTVGREVRWAQAEVNYGAGYPYNR
jgi:hypothetical protein